MYTELVSRFLLGGWANGQLYINILADAEVTHVVNLYSQKTPDMLGKQFQVFECGTREESVGDTKFWMKLFEFTAKAYRSKSNRIYFHCPVKEPMQGPVGCYAGLRALGFSSFQSRKKLNATYPNIHWNEGAIAAVDQSFPVWCQAKHVNPEEQRERQRQHLIEVSRNYQVSKFSLRMATSNPL